MVGTFRIQPLSLGRREIFAWSHGDRNAVAPPHRMVPFWYSSVVIWRSWSDDGNISDIRLRLHGPQPKTYFYSPRGAVELFGIAVTPELSSMVVGIANHEIAGQIFDWPNDHFDHALALAKHGAHANTIVDAMALPVLKTITKDQNTDIDHAIKIIRRTQGTPSLRKVSERIGLGSRQFRARFKDRIGISPKAYSRLLRANALIAEADQITNPSWSDLSHRYGFFDQAHLINELRELTGQTPARLDSERRMESQSGLTHQDMSGNRQMVPLT